MTYREYCKNRYKYQEDGVLLLLEKKHACLYYKPGKGKTYPCIDALREVDKSKNFNAKILILSTADSIKNMWNVEIVPQNILPINTILMTLNSAIVENTKNKLLKVKWDIVIIDECHKVKSHNSKMSKLVYLLTKNSEYAWGLSGTPRGNNELDIFNQFHNLNIGDWGNISYTNFVYNVCETEQRYFNGHTVLVPIRIKQKYIAGWERNIAEFTQRIGYEEKDNMPELKVNEVRIPYEITKEYTNAEDGIIQISDYETTMTKLVAIMKCHQAANGYLYYDKTETNENVKIYRFQHNKKLDWLKDNLFVNGVKPTVIVYKHKADLEDLQAHFVDWTEDVGFFKNGGCSLLFLQCSRCESFNLQMCNRIIFYTLDYSYIKYNQMLHRIWRMGQENECQIDILLFEGTIEESIWKAVKHKENMADMFMHIKENI